MVTACLQCLQLWGQSAERMVKVTAFCLPDGVTWEQGAASASPHRATGPAPCPPPLPGDLALFSPAECRQRGAEAGREKQWVPFLQWDLELC